MLHSCLYWFYLGATVGDVDIGFLVRNKHGMFIVFRWTSDGSLLHDQIALTLHFSGLRFTRHAHNETIDLLQKIYKRMTMKNENIYQCNAVRNNKPWWTVLGRIEPFKDQVHFTFRFDVLVGSSEHAIYTQTHNKEFHANEIIIVRMCLMRKCARVPRNNLH